MRRYDLDWLRVIVFGLLIFYHCGMFFVPWEWHIKNNRLYPWLEFPMIFVNQWRLPILFVISGMGTSFAFAKRTGLQFAKERIKRLLIPLIFGVLFIVPPQIYLERISKGDSSINYWSFLSNMFDSGLYPEGDLSWHHLWFLPYLLMFSLLLTPVFVYLKNNNECVLMEFTRRILKSPLSLIIFSLPLISIQIFLKPFFPQTYFIINDWFTLSFNIFLFLYGFVLVSAGEIFWTNVRKNRRRFLITGLISFAILLILKIKFPQSKILEPLVSVINTEAWMLTLFGFAARYLNKPGKFLSYANKAVYPFYILHQTIIIAIAFLIQDLEWSLGLKYTLILTGTFGITWLIYDKVVLRNKIIQPLFGIKSKKFVKHKEVAAFKELEVH